ncbi:hypothetical protein Tco_1422311 [Tanacetum coccineum]
MNTTQAQQKSLDDALVALVDRLEFGKCNMRLKKVIKPKEATFQVVLDALALTPFYQAFLITADEDFLFQIEYKDAKKTNKMSYLRFIKIIIDYFMLKDQSISRRNKMFWHSAQDDTMFTSMRYISRHKDTQVYGTILLKELTNQEMLESNAYKTYYAFAYGEKTPKLKYVQKKVDSNTSPKQKLVQATKGTRLKSKAKVAKPDKKKQPAKKTKAKGLAILSKVALIKAEQLKLATKRSKTQFHSSHASGSGDGGDSENEDEYDENDSDELSDEGDDDNDGNIDNDGDDDDANDDDKQEGDDTNDDDEETDSDRTESNRIKIPILDQSTTEFNEEEEENIDNEETMYDDEDDEVTKELLKM